MSGTMTVTTWEYKIEVLDFLMDKDEPLRGIEAQLNELGKQGWEVVSVTPKMGRGDSWTFVYLKRPKPE